MSVIAPSGQASSELTTREMLVTCMALMVHLPITLIKALIQHVRLNDKTTSAVDCLRVTTRMCLGANVPARVIQRMVGRPDPNTIRESNRFLPLRSQILEHVSHLDFSGYWICRGMYKHAIEASDADLVIYHIHGGGYVLGDPIADAPNLLFVAEQLSKAGITPAIFALDYTLVPHRVFPHQFDQAAAGYKWLIGEQKVSASKVLILGESAGGHLALSLLVDLCHTSRKDGATPKPAHLFLMSPWCNLYNSHPLAITTNVAELNFKRTLTLWADLAVQDLDPSQKTLRQNYASRSTALGSWKDILPESTWVSAGSLETIFKYDIADFVEQARLDGVSVSLEVEKGEAHAWQTVLAMSQHPEYLNSEPDSDRPDLLKGYRRLAACILAATCCSAVTVSADRVL